MGQCLVEERLVACVNILPHLKSLYWWEGKIVIEQVKELQSSSIPAIVALSILGGDKSYLDWIKNETQESQ